MRIYRKPELNIEFFEVEDVITVSGFIGEPEETFTDPEISVPDVSNPDEPSTDFIEPTEPDVTQTTREPVIFEEEIMGGNPVQEVLNNLYENFMEIF